MAKNDKLKFGSDCAICMDTTLLGEITFGDGCVVHPKAIINAEAGPIVIGPNNLIEETAQIINRKGGTLEIGKYNLFEIGSVCCASRVGDNNVLEIKSYVGPEVELGDGISVGTKCVVDRQQIVPNNTVFYGEGNTVRTARDRPQTQQGQMEFLRKYLPNYHYLASKKK